MNFKALYIALALGLPLTLWSCIQQTASADQPDFPAVITDPVHYNPLSKEEKRVMVGKGTEMAFTGAYHNSKKKGTYICKQCNQPLFASKDKFDSRTGWPSFDDMIDDAVLELPDADGRRTEIVCSNCQGHLGHVFRGEGFTSKQTRHCVNSVSLNFVSGTLPQTNEVIPISRYVKGKGYKKYAVATFAGGCFWCTEAAFERIEGVVDVISGYSGGKVAYPSYKEIGRGNTGHTESIMIYYEENIVGFETLLEVFFVAHNPTQLNRQGPDIGTQYRSAIFYHNDEQKTKSEAFFKIQDGKFDKPIVTELNPYEEFWVAEAYHQDYYKHHPENPYVQNVSKPKVKKVEKTFAKILKPQYKPN